MKATIYICLNDGYGKIRYQGFYNVGMCMCMIHHNVQSKSIRTSANPGFATEHSIALVMPQSIP